MATSLVAMASTTLGVLHSLPVAMASVCALVVMDQWLLAEKAADVVQCLVITARLVWTALVMTVLKAYVFCLAMALATTLSVCLLSTTVATMTLTTAMAMDTSLTLAKGAVVPSVVH